MEITVRSARITSLKTPLLALPTVGPPFQDPNVASLDSVLGGALRRIAREEGFKGKAGQTITDTVFTRYQPWQNIFKVAPGEAPKPSEPKP